MHPPPTATLLKATLNAWSRTQGQHWLPITGRSMHPLLQEGDHVLVVHGHANVRRGDIAVFQQGGKLIAHRVIGISGSGMAARFVTKGDHTLHFDPPVDPDRMVGRVVAVKRGDRLRSLHTPAWRIMGWLIAISTAPWQAVDGWIRLLKPRQPNRLVAFLRRCLLAFSSGIRSAMACLCRR